MDIKDAERIVIAKPVASKPSCSSLKSFTSLLSGAISAASPTPFSETAVVAIRPKTVRFKPAVTRASDVSVSPQGGVSEGAACYSCERVSKPEAKVVVYKPLAKLVSSKTAHLLASLGNFESGREQAKAYVPSQDHPSDQAKHQCGTDHTSTSYQRLPSQEQTNLTNDPSKVASDNLEENQRAFLSTILSADRPSYDGYNWRKYGQKQVKGSEYPRSYYKCTHTNCPVKKKVERSLDGQIAEIVYKGEHNHQKPQPPKRPSSLQEQGFVSDTSGQEARNFSHHNERNEGSEARIENTNEAGSSINTSNMNRHLHPYDPVMVGAFNSSVGTTDTSCGFSGDCDEGSRGANRDDDEPKSKRRKNGHQLNEVGITGKIAQEPRVMVENTPDSEIVGDGFRWRKYGQKVVKGNPYPRSYYKCTNAKCNVRKHVERASDDPKSFITTYEGKHNHEMPAIKNQNPAHADPDSAAPSKSNKKWLNEL